MFSAMQMLASLAPTPYSSLKGGECNGTNDPVSVIDNPSSPQIIAVYQGPTDSLTIAR